MKLLSTMGITGVLETVLPEWQKAVGVVVEASYAPTALMLERIRAGEHADLAFLTTAGIDALIAEGVLRHGSRVDLCRSLTGIAVRAGAPRPDLSSVEATRRSLVAARSIVYSAKGQSGIFFAGLIERLSIARDVNARAIVVESGTTADLVAAGRAELAVQQVSELMLVPGVDVAGPLPPEIQDDLVFAGGIFARTARAQEAGSLVRSMADPARAALYAAKGLEPLHRT